MGAMLWFSLAAAATLHVPAEFPTVGAAWSAADDGDEIVVAKGRHGGGPMYSLTGKSVTLRGEPGAVLVREDPSRSSVLNFGESAQVSVQSITLDGEGITRGLAVFDEAVVDLVDVEITNGIGAAGGIFATQSAVLTMTGGSIRDSESDHLYGGGALHSTDTASVLLTDVVVEGNEGNEAGAVRCAGSSTCTIVRSQLLFNRAEVADGGAIHVVDSGRVVVRDSLLCGNSAAGNGGAVAARGGTNLFSDGNVYLYNMAEQGGALDLAGVATVTDDTLYGNAASLGAAFSAVSGVVVDHSLVVAHATEPVFLGEATLTSTVLFWDNVSAYPAYLTGDPDFIDLPADCVWDPRVQADGAAVTYGDPTLDGVIGAGAAYDLDLDGYGDDDCDDDDPERHPGQQEVCSGKDDDCDGQIDDADDSLEAPLFFADLDEDGYGTGPATPLCHPTSAHSPYDGDCDDDNADASPGQVELCATPFDDDCDGSGEAGAADGQPLYADADADGVGGDDLGVVCPAEGRVEVGGDCDDADAGRTPGATEVCGDGVDQDCDEIDAVCPGDGTAPDTVGSSGADETEGLATACGCQAQPGVSTLAWLLVALLGVRRRQVD